MISKKNLCLALFINIYFMAICLGFCHLRYGAIDDYFMAGILSGMYGEEFNVHLPFVNAIYGYLLLPFYHLFPHISWYYIGELASIFISFFLITYVLIDKIGHNWGSILSILLMAAYAKDMYIVLQFTQCAEALSAAGMIILLWGFEYINDNPQKRKTWIILLIGILLLWWGSFMRWEAFLMGIPFFAITLLLSIRKFWGIRHHVIISLLTAYLGTFAFHEFNQSLYQSPEYKTFSDFQPFRVLLGDGSFYNEQAVYEDMQEMGLEPKDFDLLKKWVFYDNEVFAPESVQAITQLINTHSQRFHINTYPSKLLQIFSKFALTPIFFIWLLFGLSLFISNKRKFYFLWISLVPITLELAYLLYANRLVYRVEIGLWLYATILTIFFLRNKPILSSQKALATSIILVIITGFVFYNNRDEFRSPQDGEAILTKDLLGIKGYSSLFAFMDSQPDSVIFIVPMETYMNMTEHRLPPYLNEPIGSWQRIIPSGYWTPYFPDVEKSFRKRGVNNPIKDLVKDNVYYVSDVKFGLTLVDFLEIHHYNHVKIDTIKKFEDIFVIKHSVVQDSIGATK